MRLLFTGGGTGGHVYPGLAVIERLRANFAISEIAWVGRSQGIEREIVERYGIPFIPILSGALRGRGPGGAIISLYRLAQGMRQGIRILKEWRADAIFATGGYVTAPLVLAAWLLKRPVLIYLPDMEPGLAVRFLSRFATCMAVTFDDVKKHFRGRRVIATGYPVRQAFWAARKEEARSRLGLQKGWPTLLVLGGSSGARSINRAIAPIIGKILERAQVIHITGPLDLEALQAARENLPEELKCRYLLTDYMHDAIMDAMAAADLAVARAGASTLGEFPALGLPAILVPYPYAGGHQRLNAAYMAARGAAIIVEDHALHQNLESAIITLLENPQRLHEMAEASRALSVRDAAERLASLLVSLAKGNGHG